MLVYVHGTLAGFGTGAVSVIMIDNDAITINASACVKPFHCLIVQLASHAKMVAAPFVVVLGSD